MYFGNWHIVGPTKILELHKRVFDQKIWLSYSKTEICQKIGEIKNEIFKETLRYKKIKNGIEIHTISDVPGNSGLGSSGAFTSALIYFLDLLKKNKIYKKDIASMACKIEMNYLKKNSGIQDQYISVFGGLKEIFVSKTGKVRVKSLKIEKKNIRGRTHIKCWILSLFKSAETLHI